MLPPQAEGADVRIRIFTPAAELPFAGHPTLGSAFVLGGPLQAMVLRLETGAGIVPVELEREGARIIFGWMEQPMPTWRPFAAGGRAARGARARAARRRRSRTTTTACRHVMVGVETAERAGGARAGHERARARGRARHGLLRARGTAAGRRACSLRRSASPEDPATGSAAGPLAVHLARHGRIAFGDEIEIEQGVEIGRPVDALRAGRRLRRRDRARARRRLGGDRRARRVRHSLAASATASISGSSTSSAFQKMPPSRET